MRLPDAPFDPQLFDGIPPETADALLDRLGEQWLRTVPPSTAVVEQVTTRGRVEQLIALIENPGQDRPLPPGVHRRLAELTAAAGARAAEDLLLTEAHIGVYRWCFPEFQHRHESAAGPFAGAIADAVIEWRPADDPTTINPLLATGDPRIARRLLELPSNRSTDGEQARAVLLLMEHGRAAELRELLDRPHPRSSARFPRRRIRRLLRQAFPVDRTAHRDPGTPDDPRLAPIRTLAERHAAPGAVFELLHRYPHEPLRALAALPLPAGADAVPELIRRHRRAALPPAVREHLLRTPGFPPAAARELLNFGGRKPVPTDAAQDIAGTAVRRELLDFGDLVRHVSPARALFGLDLAVPNEHLSDWDRRTRRPARNRPEGTDRDTATWNRTEYQQIEQALRELLGTAGPTQLIEAGRRILDFPGTLPELLAASADGPDVPSPDRPSPDDDGPPDAAPATDRPADTRLGQTNFLLAHAPVPAVRAVLELLPVADVLHLIPISRAWIARVMATANVPGWTDHLGIYETIAGTRTEPAVRAALLDGARADYLKPTRWNWQHLLPCLARLRVPGAAEALARDARSLDHAATAVTALGTGVFDLISDQATPNRARVAGIARATLQLLLGSADLPGPERRRELRCSLDEGRLTEKAEMQLLRAFAELPDERSVAALATRSRYPSVRTAADAVRNHPDPARRPDVACSYLAGRGGALLALRVTVAQLRAAGPETDPGLRLDLAADCAVPWPEVIADYRRGEPLPLHAARLICFRPDLPGELAELMLEGNPGLLVATGQRAGEGNPRTWPPVLALAAVRRGEDACVPAVVLDLADAGLLGATELMGLRVGDPAAQLFTLRRLRRGDGGGGSRLYAEVLARCAELIGSAGDPVEAWIVADRLQSAFPGTLSEWASTAAMAATTAPPR